MSGTDQPGPPIPREGIRLGSVGGIPIILAYSWFLIAGFIVLVFGPQVAGQIPGLGWTAYLVAFSYALLLLLSVLVHELAHALSARVYHWPTAKIVLNLWGGHTQFENFSASPGKSLVVALAGPAANFLLAAGGLALMPLMQGSLVAQLLADIFVWANFLVAVFNVLPGLPLDGGRIVESAVWKATGSQEKGTVAAGWAGRVIAVLMVAAVILVPLSQGVNPGFQLVLITVLVAGFLWLGASGAITNARMRLRLPEISAGRLAVPAVGVASSSSAATVKATLGTQEAGSAAVVLVGSNGRPEAVVDTGALDSVPGPMAASTPASAVARALAPGAYVPAWAQGQELVQYLAQLAGSEYAVIDRGGRVTGLLHQATVVAAITGKQQRGFDAGR
ncbi:site-2 protease family protein [Arthrobacter castelli]|uniref:site-2 protease family protein n=1 Tax=Arthrobacter castelli TaxID=271431 RepID=UPI000406E963|nr:site-2 protease family protein [Arthrobacter castelli]